jgi:D-alanyl-D-alanine carboxypeptidase
MKTKKLISAILSAVLLTTAICADIYAVETTTEATTEATTEEPSVIVNNADSSVTLSIGARACILIDADSGTVIYSKNPDERLYPASITKILTTYLACVNGNMDDTVTFSHNAVYNIGAGSSIIGMNEGEQIKFKDALYGIMLESANEVCMAIAEHIDGSVDKFVERMNNQVAEWGLTNTHFANPHGFHDDNHYTTAADMAQIAYHAIQNEDFAKIWGTVTYTIPATNLAVERNLNNKDKMLRPTSPYYYEYLKGGKTGFTDEARNTLVSYAERDGMRLISVVMKDSGYEAAYTDSKTLLEYGFGQYANVEVYSGGYSDRIPVYQSYDGLDYSVGNVSIAADGKVSAKLPKFVTSENTTTRAELDSAVKAPVEAGTKVGTLSILYNGNVVGTTDILTTEAVSGVSEQQLMFKSFWNSNGHYVILSLKVMAVALLVMLILLILLYIRGSVIRSRKRKRRLASSNRRPVKKNGKSGLKSSKELKRKSGNKTAKKSSTGANKKSSNTSK